MDRRTFLKAIGLVTASLAVVPKFDLFLDTYDKSLFDVTPSFGYDIYDNMYKMRYSVMADGTCFNTHMKIFPDDIKNPKLFIERYHKPMTDSLYNYLKDKNVKLRDIRPLAAQTEIPEWYKKLNLSYHPS